MWRVLVRKVTCAPGAALAEAPRGGQQAVVPVSAVPRHTHPGQDQALPWAQAAMWRDSVKEDLR